VVADSTVVVATVADIGNSQPPRRRSSSTQHDTAPILPKAQPGKDGRFCVSYFEPPLRGCGYPLFAAAFRSSVTLEVTRTTRSSSEIVDWDSLRKFARPHHRRERFFPNL
jgi:hypothetical protein